MAEAYDFSGVHRIVDVGGGTGALLAAVLGRYPLVSGVLFHRPDVIDEARATVTEHGVTERCEVVGGDCFESTLPHRAAALRLGDLRAEDLVGAITPGERQTSYKPRTSRTIANRRTRLGSHIQSLPPARLVCLSSAPTRYGGNKARVQFPPSHDLRLVRNRRALACCGRGFNSRRLGPVPKCPANDGILRFPRRDVYHSPAGATRATSDGSRINPHAE